MDIKHPPEVTRRAVLLMLGGAAAAIATNQTAAAIAPARVGVTSLKRMTDKQLVDQLDSNDYRVGKDVAEIIVSRGAKMVEPLLRMKGHKQPYSGSLGNPQGSMTTVMPMPGISLTSEQWERVVTVEASALYLVCAIYFERLDFASSALLTDLDDLPEKRRALNKEVYLQRAFASAQAWSDECKMEGLQALRDREEDPLKSARLAFW